MRFRSDVPALDGWLVRLEPLAAAHATDLQDAAGENRSAYGFTTVPRAGQIEEYVAAHLESLCVDDQGNRKRRAPVGTLEAQVVVVLDDEA